MKTDHPITVIVDDETVAEINAISTRHFAVLLTMKRAALKARDAVWSAARRVRAAVSDLLSADLRARAGALYRSLAARVQALLPRLTAYAAHLRTLVAGYLPGRGVLLEGVALALLTERGRALAVSLLKRVGKAGLWVFGKAVDTALWLPNHSGPQGRRLSAWVREGIDTAADHAIAYGTAAAVIAVVKTEKVRTRLDVQYFTASVAIFARWILAGRLATRVAMVFLPRKVVAAGVFTVGTVLAARMLWTTPEARWFVTRPLAWTRSLFGSKAEPEVVTVMVKDFVTPTGSVKVDSAPKVTPEQVAEAARKAKIAEQAERLAAQQGQHPAPQTYSDYLSLTDVDGAVLPDGQWLDNKHRRRYAGGGFRDSAAQAKTRIRRAGTAQVVHAS